MYPPIYSICSDSAAVKAVLGDPIRLYPFGDAPQGVALPYAVWQGYGGAPENTLTLPKDDSFITQVDVYGDPEDPREAFAVAKALRDALEPHAHVIGYRGDQTDPVTGNRRVSFDVQFFTAR